MPVYLLSCDPVERHLRAHVVVERPVRVVGDHLLPGTLALAHRLQRAVPVQQLEHGHELLELEHRAALVRFEHEAKRADARVRVVRLVRVALSSNKSLLINSMQVHLSSTKSMVA